MSKLPIFQSEAAEGPSPEDESFLRQERQISTPEFLQALIEDKREEIAKMIVQDDRLVRSRDIAGASAVQLAVYHGLDEMLGILLRSEVALDLAEAAAAGQLERTRDLLARDPSAVDEPGGDGFTPLVLAATYGRLEVAQALLDAGADPSKPAQNPTRIAPLHGAAGHGDAAVALDLVERLLDRGAAVDAQQAGGFTALHRAAGQGHAAVVERLLRAGADPSLESDLGRTARELAEQRGHVAVMALLA